MRLREIDEIDQKLEMKKKSSSGPKINNGMNNMTTKNLLNILPAQLGKQFTFKKPEQKFTSKRRVLETMEDLT